MESEKETNPRKRKRLIQVLSVGFIATLILATLFSNTLQPLVVKELINPAGGEVKKIYVKEGDVVDQGQKLILYDNAQAEREWLDEAAQLEKQKLTGANLQDQLTQAIAEENNRVRNLVQEIQTRELELERLKDQYIRANTEEDEFQVRTLRIDIETRKLELAQMKSQYGTGKSEDKPEIGRIKREIESHKLDMGVQERKLRTLREQMDRSAETTAPFPGRIARLNAREGSALQDEPDLVIARTGEGFALEWIADAQMISRLGLTSGGGGTGRSGDSGRASTALNVNMPAGFYLTTFVGDEAAFGQTDLDDKSWDWKAFGAVARSLKEKALSSGQQPRYALGNLRPNDVLSEKLKDEYSVFVDQEAKKAFFDTAPFIETMEEIKHMYEDGIMTDRTPEDSAPVFYSTLVLSMEELIQVPFTSFASPKLLYRPHAAGETGGMKIAPGYQFAIRDTSAVKEEALTFIAFLLSEEIQSLPERDGFSLLQSVNRQKLERIQEKLKSGTFKLLEGEFQNRCVFHRFGQRCFPYAVPRYFWL